jgi:tight adherence protein B
LSFLLGAVLGIGILLSASPLLWPTMIADAGSNRSGNGRRNSVRDMLNQAGFSRVPLSVFVALSACTGLAAGAVAEVLLGVLALDAGIVIAGFALPFTIVRWRAHSRRRAARTVWPDAVDHLVSAVRSGIALPDSVSTLAHAGPSASRTAFAEFEAGYRSTGNFGISIDALKARLADPVADRILETLRMSREVGGSDLTRVLRNLSAYLRDDAAIRAEVAARQSWVMNAAKLGVAAPWVVLLLLASRPEAALAYNTPQGTLLILGGLGVTILAYRIMLAIGRLPEERRWFS